VLSIKTVFIGREGLTSMKKGTPTRDLGNAKIRENSFYIFCLLQFNKSVLSIKTVFIGREGLTSMKKGTPTRDLGNADKREQFLYILFIAIQ
jgi:hypothetical protein